MEKDNVTMVAKGLLIIGGLNWGLFALGYNAVAYLAVVPYLDTIVYALVALSAVYIAIDCAKGKKKK